MDLYSMQVHESRFWDGPFSCQARPLPGQMSLLQPVLQQLSHPRRTYARGTLRPDARSVSNLYDLVARHHRVDATFLVARGPK